MARNRLFLSVVMTVISQILSPHICISQENIVISEADIDAVTKELGELSMLTFEDIRIRDPFILPVEKENLYYLYGTTDKHCRDGLATGFDCYTSKDLRNWTGPHPVFRPGEDFWSDRNFWAPEVHLYGGKYYMFASFKAERVPRGTQILVADSPQGPFKVHSPKPVTPPDWESLDGTLFVDDEGFSWMVFCHEWVQVGDGEICAVQLSSDLKEPIGEPILLFSASEAPWVYDPQSAAEKDRLITDGPFLHTTRDGSLVMLWSSFSRGKYMTGIAMSLTGQIDGPWVQQSKPVFSKDGGHAMLFRTFSGQLIMCLHSPNKGPFERVKLLTVSDADGGISVI